ncbi:MAG: HAMP domain-containing histidine kinase [Deltaproteobacteria bacterium]|nr:HAMP domain-containing histidine kinase [Deltaproteobacteria bacterium]
MRAFWLLVLVPLAVAGWLAVRVSSDGAELRRHEIQQLLDGRLADVRTRTGQALATLERQLGEALANAPATPEELRALGRRIPLARQVFRLDARGHLVFPGPDPGRAEREFLERTASIWTGRAILAAPVGPGEVAQPRAAGALGVGDSLVDLARRRPHGWLTWYWAEGLHLLYWQRANNDVIGVEVERIGVMSRIVGALPTASLVDGRMELADSRGEVVHQWGDMGVQDERPDASVALEAPLDAWHLRYYLAPSQRAALEGGGDTGLYLGLAAIGLATLVLAAFIYREYTRRLRDAAQRVGFTTRVSHELRTPLTNIRMYAELLEQDLEDARGEGPEESAVEDGRSIDDQQRRVRVIVGEAQRLGRLIDNVLAYARHQRGTLVEPAATSAVDEVVRDAVAKFEPVLGARGIEVRFELRAPPPVRAGSDTVDQIVVNLLSNVEKYAASGGEVVVSTRADGERVIVGVADRGPGVPAGERAAIFEPFHRAADSLTGASGTGIGLAISRELARAAGGDLALVDSERGAAFELTLPSATASPIGGPP